MGTPPVEIYDTTLRDGTQREGVSLTVRDKLRVAQLIDELGVAYIEGGWPGANPKDDEFFELAKTDLKLQNATLVAFGATRKAGGDAVTDGQLAALVAAETDVICLVGKAWDYHVTEALRTDLDEAVAMVVDSIAYLRSIGKRVFFDAEHFFDGYLSDPDFAVRIVREAQEAGAERVILCDTNGGTLPAVAGEIVLAVRDQVPEAVLGCHFHNDSGCAVAASLSALEAGVTQVQGCMNGYGERTGNADLCTLIPDLKLKVGLDIVSDDQLTLLAPLSHQIAEIVNLTLDPQHPFVWDGGVHPQGGASHFGSRQTARCLRAHRSHAGRQHHSDGRFRAGRPVHDPGEGQGAGLGPALGRGPGRAGSGEGVGA